MNDGDKINVKTEDIYKEHAVLASGKPLVSSGLFVPQWLKQDQKATLLHQIIYRRGCLSIGRENLWDFVINNRDGNNIVTVPIANILYFWQHKLQENTFELGWQDIIAR